MITDINLLHFSYFVKRFLEIYDFFMQEGILMGILLDM